MAAARVEKPVLFVSPECSHYSIMKIYSCTFDLGRIFVIIFTMHCSVGGIREALPSVY